MPNSPHYNNVNHSHNVVVLELV